MSYDIIQDYELRDIWEEYQRQIVKWGAQHHPDGTALDGDIFLRDLQIQECDRAHRAGEGTWRHILTEEVAEAYAESDPERLARELIQVAAVCLNWVKDINSRKS